MVLSVSFDDMCLLQGCVSSSSHHIAPVGHWSGAIFDKYTSEFFPKTMLHNNSICVDHMNQSINQNYLEWPK